MLSENGPIVLAFHKVMPRFSYGVTNYDPRRMHKLLSRLADQEFSFMDESVQGSRSVRVTFDDGYAHLADTVPSLMERFGFRPVVFVPTGWIGRPNRWDYSHVVHSVPHLTEHQITALHRRGVMFGSHGHSHRELTGLPDGCLREELRSSRRRLEDLTGERVTLLSYPFGRHDERVRDAARTEGYTAAYTMKHPSAVDPPLALGRVAVYGFDTVNAVVRRMKDCRIERIEAAAAHALSGGTVLLNRLRGI